jgi:hypothetical protein
VLKPVPVWTYLLLALPPKLRHLPKKTPMKTNYRKNALRGNVRQAMNNFAAAIPFLNEVGRG